MEIQKATGIVLGSRTIGEADCLVRFYTREFGKRDFSFKGLKKSKRRPRSIIDPGTVAGLVYYYHEEKNIHTVNEFQIVRQHINIRNDLRRILALYFFIEAVEKTTGHNDANRPVFDLLTAGIETLSETEHTGHLPVFFIIHLLRLHGVLPETGHCKICKSSTFTEFIIDNIDFHAVCGKCSPRHNPGNYLKNSCREFLRISLKEKFTAIDHSAFPESDIRALLYQLCLFMQSYFHIEIKSKDMLLSELSKTS